VTAAGTFAMIDMTAFKSMSMKIVAIKLDKNLWKKVSQDTAKDIARTR
jgi:hypothetical protein